MSSILAQSAQGGGRIKEMLRGRAGKRGSSSSGSAKKTKGHNCKTSPQKRYWLTSPKAYKKKGYDENFRAIIKKAGTKA
jgi:hypothetical protein